MTTPVVGLALGGGGARGMAHIGVLKVLEKHNIPIHCIAGTSIGALVGSGYALHPDAKQFHARITEFIKSPQFQKAGLSRFTRKEPAENFFGQVAKYVKQRIVINLAHSKLSVVSSERLYKIISFTLENRNIEQSQIPLAVVASDLISGEAKTFTRGSIRKAVLASASIPGFLPPVTYNGHYLVDGAVTAPIPVEAVRELGANIVIAVDVGQDMLATEHATRNIVDLIFRTNSITAGSLRNQLLEKADFVIRPEVGNIHWADFSEFDRLVELGEAACEAVVEKIADAYKQRRSLVYRLTHREN
ncbi:MAG: patatin-like phospholipase family protein [Deferribacteres bacterium]|nr:patatin-like phospholipase family protein [candidate division KSB1 bacterium]MCB9500984.1 patatin-like phospholipase family protein [Deferribacteres bacterium]